MHYEIKIEPDPTAESETWAATLNEIDDDGPKTISNGTGPSMPIAVQDAIMKLTTVVSGDTSPEAPDAS